jgi:(1->4)-alpha-D-glucan 1-alpha-D-glucosylmutase
MTDNPRPLLSTYRLQFHSRFTFDDAAAIVPYLHDLGITHVYASPYFKAVAGSMHGYDVIDHSRLNPEIGDTAAYKRFVDALSRHGMSHILDIVPNHVGVDTNDNPWWNDVIRHGRGSRYADFFDIDWGAGDQKLLLPVLGEPIGQAIDGGKITIVETPEGPLAKYYDRQFPMALPPSPGTPGEGRGEGDSEHQAVAAIPVHPHPDPLPAYREREPDSIYRTLQSQHFRLAHWKVAPDEINYRRFFDVTSLAAIRMERTDVFEATHRFLFELIREGAIAGIRTDHPDGLTDPRQYLIRLQQAYKSSVPDAHDPLPVWVEKILSTGETLRPDWPVAGTSGYDFLSAVNNLYVDPAAEEAMSAVCTDFTGKTLPYDEVVYSRKWTVLENALSSELTSLTRRLKALAETSRHSRDFTCRQLRSALQSVIAGFPVYRTYVSATAVEPADERELTIAIGRARNKSKKTDPAVFDFIADAVLQRLPDRTELTLPLAQKFQQLTSPVMAKGVEDTTFYIFNRLASLNEVGGDPGRFGSDADALHAYFADRQKNWPMALSCLSTHDTKRSEDVRARISVLSEIPDQWRTALAEFDLAGPATIVSANDRYLLYQTLLGSWIETDSAEYVTRVQTYMLKAVREAKTRSSWTEPNTDYESAVKNHVAELIAGPAGQAFRDAFQPLLRKVTTFGYLNSLSQTLIRLTAPGVPDTYQGSEMWDFSLVDPDNRRPVDYTRRAEVLKSITDASFPSLIETLGDGRAKLFLTHRCLQCRQRHADLFTRGSYIPLKITGRFARNVFAFARSHGDRTAVAVACRSLTHLCGSPVGTAWADTAVQLPEAGSEFESVLDGRRIYGNPSVRMSDLFSAVPVALLIR